VRNWLHFQLTQQPPRETLVDPLIGRRISSHLGESCDRERANGSRSYLMVKSKLGHARSLFQQIQRPERGLARAETPINQRAHCSAARSAPMLSIQKPQIFNALFRDKSPAAFATCVLLVHHLVFQLRQTDMFWTECKVETAV
jgi:hypothetical protein